MASISSLGISGLPLTDLLENLRKVEEAPLALLENRRTSYQTKISGYGLIQNSLSALQTSLKSLTEANTFTAMTATSSKPEALMASIPANSAAVAGSYSIDVNHLATTQSLVSAGQDSRNIPLSASNITLKLTVGGETHEIEVAAAKTSLEGLRAAINDAGLDVSATLLNNGGDTNAHQLTLSTTATGTAASITKIEVEGDDSAGLQALLGYDASVPVDPDNPVPGAMTEATAARDAQLRVNGVLITSGSNTIENAIEGVTLNLLQPTAEGAPLQLRVAANNSVATTAVNAFVSAYNSLQSVIGQLTSYDVEANAASALTGDRVPRAVQTQLRSVLGSLTGEGGIQMLSQLGITTDPSTGRLQTDAAKLEKVIAENKGDVAAFFTGENGLAAKMNRAVSGLLASDGMISTATQGLQKSIQTVVEQYEATSVRVDDTIARYQAQFVQLERLMSQMNSTSSYLTTQLGMLETLSSGKQS